MTFVLNKSVEKNEKLELYSPGGICHLFRDKQEALQQCSCTGYCEECQLYMQALERCGCEKAAVYNLLRRDMMGMPAQVFTRYHEGDIIHIRSHLHGEQSKLTKGIIVYDANALCLYCLGDVMPCGKDMLVVNKKPFDQNRIAKFSEDVLKGKVFGFAQVDIEVPNKLYDNFSKMAALLLFKRFLIVMYLGK